MRTSAVICEFNPLHHGHMHILSAMRKESDCVIAIMSGNFVQRSSPAVIDKYERAKNAISAGADLVLELPFPWCAASAEYFAKAGTAIAENVFADELYFGVGAENPAILNRVVDLFLDEQFNEEVRRRAASEDISRGIASVREDCLKSKLGVDCVDVLRMPNDILAIEYLMQIRKNGYHLLPHFIPRLTEKESPVFASATTIREIIRSGEIEKTKSHVPDFVYESVSHAYLHGECAREDAFFETAFRMIRTDLSPFNHRVAEGEGGLFRHIHKAAHSARTPAEMLALAATKKYTNARIRRVLLYYLTGITPEVLRDEPRVTTVLAANDNGCAYLSSIRKKTPLSILTKPASYRDLPAELQKQYRHTVHADCLYTLCVPCGLASDHFLKQSPQIAR